MAHDLPAWVAELTDPRRATTLDQLADRLVPLAEHSIDVSRRLQNLLTELNEPFKREALYDRVERLKARADEAFREISKEITTSSNQRIDRVWEVWRKLETAHDRDGELRSRLAVDVLPALAEQERAVADEPGAGGRDTDAADAGRGARRRGDRADPRGAAAGT